MSAFFSSLFARWRFGLVFAVFMLASAVTHAAEPTVRATLDRSISVIGDPVQLQIKVSGARRVGNLPDITVDGLQINYANQQDSSVMRFENGAFTAERSIILIYQVVPERNGTFTIPSLTIQADGRNYRTEPVALTVHPSSAGDDSTEPGKIGFAELVVPKKTIYLGEAVPLELRLYVDANVRWQPVAMPEIGGEGFTKQKMPEPKPEHAEKNGREYDMLAFKTSITPIRAGKLTVGPSEVIYNARVPHARRSGPRSPFDDMFSDPFFAATQQLKTRAEAVELTVKPLPQTGKPADFSGAVGHFQFSAEGAPKQVKVGDPITMKLRVSGHGNFDRVAAPALNDTTGWRTYPPSSSFKTDDEFSTSGTKTFEVAVVPEAKKTAMPVFHFSYFDPLTEKYVTLNSETAPLTVEAGTAPAPAAAAPVPDSATPPPKKAPPELHPDDILGLRYDSGEPESFAPLYERREFWWAQGALAVVLLGVTGMKMRRRPDAAALQKAALRHEKEAVWHRLRGSELGYVDFFDTAARLAQLDTALATGRPAGSIDAATVRASAQLDESTAEAIDDIFNARAEMHYAGGDGGNGDVAAEERKRVLGALKQLEKSHAAS